MRSVTFTSGEHVLSPSINSKLRSLILADQAMGLTMAPKFSPLDVQASSSPASSSVSMPAQNFTPAHVAPPFTSLAQERVAAENIRADISDAQANIAKESVVNAIPAGANASAVQWGLTRALPETLQDRTAALNEIRTRHDATCPLCCAAGHYTNTVLGEGSANAELVLLERRRATKKTPLANHFKVTRARSWMK